MGISKTVDLTILVLVSMFFVGLLAFEYAILGLQQPIVPIPVEWKSFFDILIWPIATLLVIELILKYRKINDPKKFVKKHWIDIMMLILIPIFSALKFFKLGLNIVKKLKTAKIGLKILHKTKKVSQK
ncbi:MAG: hypothetical protein ACRD9Q_04645 [Nitrososphaeraceae archaeon]